MDTLIKILGIVFLLIAVVYFLKPGILKWLMQFFKKGRRIYFAGLIRLILAVVFFLAARECRIPWLITTFGILFLISGLLIFTLGLQRIKAILDWYQGQPPLIFRFIALIVFIFGAVIIYAA